MANDPVVMDGVMEYAEFMEVELVDLEPSSYNGIDGNRWVVKAYNEAGHNCTKVDLFELIAWLAINRAWWLEKALRLAKEQAKEQDAAART